MFVCCMEGSTSPDCNIARLMAESPSQYIFFFPCLRAAVCIAQGVIITIVLYSRANSDRCAVYLLSLDKLCYLSRLGPMVKHAVPSASLKDPWLVHMTPSSDAIEPRTLRVDLLIAG